MSERRHSPETLDRVRREIESVDRSIVLLIAARLDAAQRAIRLRSADLRQVTDGSQERRVLRRAAGWARELGVPEALVERLFRTLIEEGKARYRCASGSRGAGFVTVLLASPEGASGELRAAPSPQLVAVPRSR